MEIACFSFKRIKVAGWVSSIFENLRWLWTPFAEFFFKLCKKLHLIMLITIALLGIYFSAKTLPFCLHMQGILEWITIVQNSASQTELSAIAHWKNVVNCVDSMKIPKKKKSAENTILVNSVATRSLPCCRKKIYTWLILLLQLPFIATNNRRFTGKYSIMTKSSIIL